MLYFYINQQLRRVLEGAIDLDSKKLESLSNPVPY